MELYFGQIIPKGFAVSCTSWENDGDDYKTEVIYDVKPQFIPCWRAVAEAFASTNSRSDAMGNEDYSGDAFFEYCVEHPDITQEFCVEVLGFAIPVGDYSEDEFDIRLEDFYTIQYEVMDKIQELIGTPVGYDIDYFMRVAETFKVYFFEEDIIIPKAPTPIETVSI